MAEANPRIRLLCIFKEYRKPIVLEQYGDLYEEIRIKFGRCNGFDFNTMHLQYHDVTFGLIDLDDMSGLDDRKNDEIIISCKQNDTNDQPSTPTTLVETDILEQPDR